MLSTPDGGVEIDPKQLFEITVKCIDTVHQQMKDKQLTVAAVGISAFWHCFLGIDADENPTTPIIHLFDTRSSAQVEQLKHAFDAEQVHQRTGCVVHTSYWPAKLLWLKDNHPDEVGRTKRWLGFGEYLLLKLTGTAAVSTSMMSATGLWNQAKDDYDDVVLNALPITRDQLPDPRTLDQPVTKLRPEYASRWPLLDNVPWCPAIGDGACDNIGSGCFKPEQFAVMIGTSGAMRVVLPYKDIALPSGIWSYRVDRNRMIVGGALSNGGEVFKWATRTLQLPDDAQQQILGRQPGSHHLIMLPFFAGERSPYWRSDLRAAITGMTLATTPTDILHAALESIALRFRQIYDLLVPVCGKPTSVYGSGGGLQHSPVWIQMISDSLGRPLTLCLEPEASSRGAALLAAEQTGLIDTLEKFAPRLGDSTQPIADRQMQYEDLLARATKLFARIYA